MILAIDAGNSNLVLGWSRVPAHRPVHGPVPSNEAMHPLKTWRLPTHPIGTARELKAKIENLLTTEGLSIQNIENVVLASVVPEITARVREAFGEQAQVIDHTWPFSFRIGTDNPSQTGIDRLVNAEAVLRERGAPAIIVDAGTTTTICALSEGVFLGGAILPGIEACRDALPAKAAQLFTVELKAPAAAIGKSTDTALRSGVVLGYASMIDGMIRRFQTEMSPGPGSTSVPVIGTGGALGLFRENSREIGVFDADLTLKGISYLYASLRHR